MNIKDPEGTKIGLVTGENFLMSIIYSFRLGLGDFSTDGYDNISGETLIWIIFLIEAILI